MAPLGGRTQSQAMAGVRRPIDDPEVEEQWRRQRRDVLFTIAISPPLLTAFVLVPSVLFVAVVGLAAGSFSTALCALLVGLLVFASAMGAGVALAGFVSPLVFLLAEARRRALSAPWRDAQCRTWKGDVDHVVVSTAEAHFVCTVYGIEPVPDGSWAAQLADAGGRHVVLRRRGSTSLLLARRFRVPRRWRTHRVVKWEARGGALSAHVRTEDLDLQYVIEAADVPTDPRPEWIDVSDGPGRPALRPHGEAKPVLATRHSRCRSKRSRRRRRSLEASSRQWRIGST
jgi:hypothetical protein